MIKKAIVVRSEESGKVYINQLDCGHKTVSAREIQKGQELSCPRCMALEGLNKYEIGR